MLQAEEVDAVFLDIQMPGLTGLDLAQVLARFKTPPPVVFVTAHEEHAVEAFELRAVDYVLKPVREERLAEAVRRVVEAGGPAPTGDVQIPVERGGVTRFINRSEITHVEAQGDYARLHTAEGSHLVRAPLSTLAEQWAAAGFVRIHRSVLVALPHVEEVRSEGGRVSVVIGGTELPVSRRHTRELRSVLTRREPRRERPAAARVRVTGPPRRRADVVRPAGTREIDAETALGEVFMRSLLREQLGLALQVLAALALTVGLLPLLFHLVPSLGDVHVGPVPLAWLLLGVLVYPWLVLLGWLYIRRAESNERDFADLVTTVLPEDDAVNTDVVPGVVAVVLVVPRDAGDRHLRAAVLPHHERLLRRLADGAAAAQRQRDRRGVPLRRVLPRRRRPGADVRRGDALVPRRLDRRLPRAAGPRRRAAAPLGGVHAARLRRGPARLARRAQALLGAGRGIGWLYLLPQFQGAGRHAARHDRRAAVGGLARGRAGRAGVGQPRRDAVDHLRAGLPVLAEAHRAPHPGLHPARGLDGRRRRRPGRRGARVWSIPLGHPGGGIGLYTTYSLIVATFLGTMGLPHVVVRFYTNPDGRAARRTTLAVLGLLGIFYVLPPVYGALGRIYAPDLVASGSDTLVLELPSLMVGGVLGAVLTGLVTAGAFAAFLSTSSGLTIAVAGVLSQDVTGRRWGTPGSAASPPSASRRSSPSSCRC